MVPMIDRDFEASMQATYTMSTAEPTTPGTILAKYLAATGWSQSELARRAGINPAAICRAIKHGAALGRLAAMQIEKATRDAARRREVSEPALSMEVLCPKLARPRLPRPAKEAMPEAYAAASRRRSDIAHALRRSL